MKDPKGISVLDLLYPRHCPFCGEILPSGHLAHETCIRALPGMGGIRCAVCGRPLAEGTLCEDCAARPRIFRKGRSAFPYQASLRTAMSMMKFHGRAEYAFPLGLLLYEREGETAASWGCGLIVPVPMYRKKKRKRGYDQAELIAKTFSMASHVPMDRRALRRVRPTGAMKELGAKERRKNMADAFEADPKRVAGKRILLIDDIYTTGSTLEACAAALLAAGAVDVYFLTVCAAVPSDDGSC
ncbi:MAG: ComF family protein [Lachnospiraceae bacterium]|nr:ComF family protein [Lachnospiraceae bacterium]